MQPRWAKESSFKSVNLTNIWLSDKTFEKHNRNVFKLVLPYRITFYHCIDYSPVCFLEAVQHMERLKIQKTETPVQAKGRCSYFTYLGLKSYALSQGTKYWFFYHHFLCQCSAFGCRDNAWGRSAYVTRSPARHSRTFLAAQSLLCVCMVCVCCMYCKIFPFSHSKEPFTVS